MVQERYSNVKDAVLQDCQYFWLLRFFYDLEMGFLFVIDDRELPVLDIPIRFGKHVVIEGLGSEGGFVPFGVCF